MRDKNTLILTEFFDLLWCFLSTNVQEVVNCFAKSDENDCPINKHRAEEKFEQNIISDPFDHDHFFLHLVQIFM